MSSKAFTRVKETFPEQTELSGETKAKLFLRVLIIEDEQPAANRLQKLLAKLPEYNVEVLAVLDSVRSVEAWLKAHVLPQLVFMDIHLADGTAFDLLKRIALDCPIIFTTAYDQYSLDAYKTNGIDYLIKPLKAVDLQQALNKLNRLSKFLITEGSKPPGEPDPVPDPPYKQRFIVRYGEHIRSLNVEEIAYFYSANKATCARTVSGHTYPVEYHLDALEQLLNPLNFFRLNRQYLTHIQAISEMRTYSKGRVFVHLNPSAPKALIVSSERSAKFKRWLGGEL